MNGAWRNGDRVTGFDIENSVTQMHDSLALNYVVDFFGLGMIMPGCTNAAWHYRFARLCFSMTELRAESSSRIDEPSFVMNDWQLVRDMT